jgi:nitrogen fixation/metabolism regulation signal transduction histidine kinase
MKLKSFFFILAFLLMVVWTVLLFIATQENGWRFYLIEGIITFSLVYLVYFYRKVIKPLNSIAGGMDLLQAQDFSSRLAPVGQKEADHIVSIFNRMMQQLKDERTRLREQNHFLDLLISVSPMGVIILTLDEQISMANKAALEFLEEESEENLLDKTMDELKGSLADELKRIPKDTTVTIRLSDSRIYRCSRLSFIDRGFAHPFFLIESLTAEVMKA